MTKIKCFITYYYSNCDYYNFIQMFCLHELHVVNLPMSFFFFFIISLDYGIISLLPKMHP